MISRDLLSLIAAVCLLGTVNAWAADRLKWDPVKTWDDGTALLPAEQAQVRYRVYVGPSPTTLVVVPPDINATFVLLSALPQFTPGRYVGVKAVIGGIEGLTMSNTIRYAAPGEVLGLAIESVP